MRKNVIKSFAMLDSISMAANATSSIVNVINLDKASIFIDWSGTSPVGTITVEARNKPVDLNNVEDGLWYALDFGTPISVAGNTGDHLIVLNELPFDSIRIQYAATSGSGTIDALITAKQVGG